jgi:hypothetical protein
MHECPECGQACDCDGEDVWNDYASLDCEHDCEDEEDADDDYECCVDCGSPDIAGICCYCGGLLCDVHAAVACKPCAEKRGAGAGG